MSDLSHGRCALWVKLSNGHATTQQQSDEDRNQQRDDVGSLKQCHDGNHVGFAPLRQVRRGRLLAQPHPT
jgi:hypothetical protein